MKFPTRNIDERLEYFIGKKVVLYPKDRDYTIEGVFERGVYNRPYMLTTNWGQRFHFWKSQIKHTEESDK